MVLSRNGRVDENGDFDWKDALLDASIMAGLSFFTTLAGLGASGLLGDPTKALLSAGIASAVQFFTMLGIKRGLVKEGE